MFQSRCIPFTLIATAIFSTGCVKKSDDSTSAYSAKYNAELLTAEVLKPIAQKQIVLQVPDACSESEDPAYCESWLGLRNDGTIGLTQIGGRSSYAIEDLTTDGRFHLAVYPDCKMEERAASEQAANTPELKPDGMSIDPTDDAAIIIKEGDGDTDPPPLLTDADGSAVTPPEDNDESIQSTPALSQSPLLACRKFVAPGTNLGDPIILQDPATATDDAWWNVHFPKKGYPIFVNAKKCDGCRVRLLLGDNDYLTAVNINEDQLMLKSFWKKISGKISKSFNSIESGVADLKKQIGTSINIDKLDNKKLYVSAALPAAKLYSAIKEQGPEALALADGTLRDGAVYVKAGAKYTEQGGVAALNGAKYIAEYVMNNACYLGIMAHLVNSFGPIAAGYEVALSTGFLAFYNKATGPLSYESMAEDKKSPTYIEMLLIAKVFALQATAVSGKFKFEKWQDIMMDIILSAFAGNIKAGYTPIIMSKMATAICKGTDEALSAAHALVSTMYTDGISDDCLEGIRNRSVSRYEAGEDMCYSLRDEIKAAATLVPTDNKVTNAWKESVKNCPSNESDGAYLNLLEGVGCQKKRVITNQVEEVGDLVIDDTTILTHQRYWGRTTDWHASVKCPTGMVAVGMCSSGGNPDCYGRPKEILCAYSAEGTPVVDNKKYRDLFKNFNEDTALCPNNYVVSEFCSSGGNRDCSGYSQVVRCSAVNSRFLIDYSNCDTKESKSWTGRLEATAPNHVMVGLCSSGKNPDCGKDSDVTKLAMFCPLVPKATSDDIHEVFRFSTKDDHMLTANFGENPRTYGYDGAGFKLYDNDGTNRTELYRCLSGYDHFASTSTNCEGQKMEGSLGYLSTKTGSPIYRCYNGKDHLITADKSECTEGGFTIEATLGYSP